MKTTRFSGVDIKTFFANTPQITFEVTEKCNLNCTYCGYGKFYLADRRNSKRSLSKDNAIGFLNEYRKLLHSNYNKYCDRELIIGFYGGEPLVNFKLIKDVVNYLEGLEMPHRIIKYNMTTNGVLLDRFMRFLVEKDFNILISLDGDMEGNAYRVDHNGRPSYYKVIDNVLRLKSSFPEYFKRNVQFNSVIHNLNSYIRTKRFIEELFNKTPTMSELNRSGLNPKYYVEFQKMYQSIRAETADSLENSMEKLKATDPMISDLVMFLKSHSPYSYNTYLELLLGKGISCKKTLSGTCLPFSKKVFITADGDIMACEKISSDYKLGGIADGKLQLDYSSIAEWYNTLFEELESQCNMCSEIYTCSQCAFFIPRCGRCPSFSPKGDEPSQQFNSLTILREHPELYSDIMTNIRID